LQILLPEDTYGRVAPKSSLGYNNFLDVGGGVIDADYRGNIKIILYNFGETSYKVERGQAVAQLICEKLVIPDLTEHEAAWEVTLRGQGGFGSTKTDNKVRK
jgi:dUTP pyrophosphatase